MEYQRLPAKNGFLLVDGVRLDEIDLDSFKSFQTFHKFCDDFWTAYDAHYGADGMQHEDQIFDQAYCAALNATRQRLSAERAAQDIATEMATPMNIGGESYNRLARCSVAHVGWESDNTAWIVEKDGKRFVASTDHGQQALSNEDYLKGKLAEYQKLILETEDALWVLNAR
jgi:hypothetical protein